MLPLFVLLCLSSVSNAMEVTPGLRNEKLVLKGVLVRAGGPGGMHSLPDSTLYTLCEQGFRVVYYLYPDTDFRNPGAYECSRGTLEYKRGSFLPTHVRP